MDRCFAPVVASDSKLLILGSLPGRQSLAEQRYYAHPRNQFWRLVGAVIDHDLSALDYPTRLDRLRQAGIGLWDVVASAERRGSLDGDIRRHQASDVRTLLDGLSEVRAVAFNGGTAARIGRRQLGDRSRLELIDLPSSSPALTWPLERKVTAWMRLRAFL